MRLFVTLFILTSFCFSQFGVVEYIIRQQQSVCSFEGCKTSSNTEEETAEETEKEIEYLVKLSKLDKLSSISLAQLNGNRRFLDLLFSSPFYQKDFKPPRCA